MRMVAKGLYDCCMDDYYMEERSSGLANFSKTTYVIVVCQGWDKSYVTYVNAGRQ